MAMEEDGARYTRQWHQQQHKHEGSGGCISDDDEDGDEEYDDVSREKGKKGKQSVPEFVISFP